MKVPEPRQLPSGKWFIQMRLNGQSMSVTEDTRSACITRAQLIKAEHMAGKRVSSASNRTIGELIDEYISDRENILSPTTIALYRGIRRNRFQKVMGMRYKDVKGWQRMVNEEVPSCSPKTLKNSWSLICAAVAAAKLDIPEATLPQVQSSPHEYLTPDQISVFMDAMQGDLCEIPALLGLHGLRQSEIYALTWDNVDLEKRSITIDGARVRVNGEYILKQTNKTQTSRRTIPILIDRLHELLVSCEDKTGLIIKTYPGILYKHIDAVCKKNNLPRIGVHGLRHSFASLAYHLNVPERIAMQMGGWSNTATMHRIYTHIAQRDVDNYAEELKSFFRA